MKETKLLYNIVKEWLDQQVPRLDYRTSFNGFGCEKITIYIWDKEYHIGFHYERYILIQTPDTKDSFVMYVFDIKHPDLFKDMARILKI